MKRSILLLTLVGLLAMAVACNQPAAVAPTQAPPPSPEPSPAPAQAGPSLEQGKALVESRCAGCHGLDRVERTSKTEAEWRKTVQRMVAKGAQLNDEELEAVIAYLTATHGK